MRTLALMLSAVLLTTSCASQSSSSQRELDAFHARRTALNGPPPASMGLGSDAVRRRESGTDSNTVSGAVGGGQQNAALTRQAVLAAVDEVRSSTEDTARAISRLATSTRELGGHGRHFIRYFDHGARQLPWLRGALGSITSLTAESSLVGDADMELGILRMTGPRLQAALSGTMLLATWLDFLNLVSVVLQQCPYYSVEQLLVDMDRVWNLLEPALGALASREQARVEATATAMPVLMGQLTHEFHSIREGARMAMERTGQVVATAQFIEMLALVSALKMSLPRLPPAAPVALGARLVMGPGGIMAGQQLVVSAEWVEMMRRLVQAGVISAPVVSAAVRTSAGHVWMAQANQELPKGVREALGDSPEVRGMHVTNRTGAGMSEAPKHHVLPQEHREWFEKRGFTGDMSIDQFCVRLERSHHEAIHGGGAWRLGRTWPHEWNQMIMGILRDAELAAGRMLPRDSILKLVAKEMQRYNIPMEFTPGRRR
ncbi:DUF2380 domain-containing protein [Myxococcus sp. CA039A]|nr:DUF2380 domain-containing protein [Myxococcus sp. CA039A]